ncbi:rhomboid family intramembrane serine protease [Xanthomonadaceae bacterium JHOS43]|nr:rhomboid family intramembrane serine protease [Xanthomonadaceae bacterium JHOS43]MCX7562242.1 rhomboid family intramembrane serine protease [Xanthomonadaceae bacterium XH05]
MFVHVPSRRRPAPPWATPLLVVACMAAWVWLAVGSKDTRGHFLQRWGTVPETLLAGDIGWDTLLDGRLLSLFTAIFVHADWLHLVGNLLFLVIFGIPAERGLGPGRLLALFLVCGALANLAAAISLQHTHAVVIVGASGAISGVIGAYLALFPRAHLGFVVPLGLFLEFVRTPASLLIAIWALLQVVFTFVGPAFGAVAWWAHLTGFCIGVAMALLWRPAVARRLRR